MRRATGVTDRDGFRASVDFTDAGKRISQNERGAPPRVTAAAKWALRPPKPQKPQDRKEPPPGVCPWDKSKWVPGHCKWQRALQKWVWTRGHWSQ